MKSQLTVTKPGGAARSLQDELVAAIQGAFEVAVEIAVREVKKLVGQATGDNYEEMRRENESLRQRLQRAEAMLSSARKEGGGGSAPLKQLFSAAPPVPNYNQMSPNPKVGIVHSNTGGKGQTVSASNTCAQRHPHPKDKLVSTNEQRSGHVVTAKSVSDAVSEPEKAQNIDVPQHISTVCVVKVERIGKPCHDPADHHSSQVSSTDNKRTFEPVTVKQEMPEAESCSDSIKVEDLTPECTSGVQSTMLLEWKPKVPDIQSQDPNSELSCSRLAEAHPSNITTGIPLLDLPPLTSELSISQPAEPAPISEGPPPIYGVHVWIRRNNPHAISNYYVCKSCNQTFPLPSLWRRHYSQCQQKLQQKLQQPLGGSNRSRLQLYPPGCSPFRCTECNREFNRMENLKTHLRIHTGERPYTCSVCSKCFRHSGALTRHFRIHTGEKPYVCGQCGKSFRNCGGLRLHQRSHSKPLQ